MIRDSLIIIFFVLLTMFMFINKNMVFYKSLSGTIYDISRDTNTINQSNITNIYTDNKLPTIMLYTDIKLPDTFMGKVTRAKASADYLITTKDSYKKDFVYVNSPVGNVKENTPRTNKPQNNISNKNPTSKTIIKPNTKEEQPSYYVLKNKVKNSVNTYYYSGKNETQDNITVNIITSTPDKDSVIIKYSVINKTNSYFFIGNTYLLTESLNNTNASFFSEQYVTPNNTLDAYVLTIKTSNKNYILKIMESGTNKRIF